MTFYLAAKYDKRVTVVLIATLLRQYGHTVNARWLTGSHDGLSPVEQQAYAIEDLEDINTADCLVLFQLPEHDPEPSTGRQIEFGYALASQHSSSGSGLRIILVGQRTSVFHYLKEVEHYPSVEAFMTAMKNVKEG